MVNNYKNINKTNNQLSSQTTHWTLKTEWHDIGHPGPGMGQAKICGMVKPVNGIPTLSLLIGSPTAKQM